MRTRWLSCVVMMIVSVGWFTLSDVGAEESENLAAGEVTAEQVGRVIRLIESQEAGQRAGAYKACRARGDGFKESYLKMLEKAEESHVLKFSEFMRGIAGEKSAVRGAAAVWVEWKAVAEPALELVLTDHDKDQRKHKEMDHEFEKAEREMSKVLSAYKRAVRGDHDVSGRVGAHVDLLLEIHLEKTWCNPDKFDAEEEPDRAAVVEELLEKEDLVETVKVWDEMVLFLKDHEKALAVNDKESWASASQREFARILNKRRAVLGLGAFYLEEKLSNACIGHSKEMIKMSYFAHESPVEEHKSFDMRAAKAGFAGSATGECIFMGGNSAAEAESAWWYSDGHRLINYAKSPNTLGIGPVGEMWTLNTGVVGR